MTSTPTTPDGQRIEHDPYGDVDWERVTRCRSQFHLHEPRNELDPRSPDHDPPSAAADADDDRSSPGALVDKYQRAGYGALAVTEHEYFVDGTKHKGEPFVEELDTTTWPWTEWDRECDPDGMVPVQGAELRGTLDGVDRLHDVVGLDTDLGHGRERSIREVATEVGDRGGVAFLPHPGKYVAPDGVDAYVELFEAVDSGTLFGVEAFNARDRYPSCRAIWDALLAELGADRPVWAVANDDYHARPRPAGAERFDRSRTVLLVEERSPSAVVDALSTGRSYVQYDGDAAAPSISSVDVEGTTVRVDAPDASAVRWIADGAAVATGAEVDVADVSARYVRAEATAPGDAVSCTQPIYLD